MTIDMTIDGDDRPTHVGDPAATTPDGATPHVPTTDDAAPDDPEVEGHLLTNPYLLERRGDGFREQMRDDITYERQEHPTRPGQGSTKRLFDKVRGRDTR